MPSSAAAKRSQPNSMPRRLPALPPHWKRDYFFYANGYVKDMDWWDASPFTVAQLPFHGMSGYPYPKPEKYPDDADALAYQLNWNDRFDSGEPVRSYRFNYQTIAFNAADDDSPRTIPRDEHGHERPRAAARCASS